MGFFDRFRKKKKAKEEGKKVSKTSAEQPAAAPAEAPLPTEPVPRAFAVARRKNAANVAAGKYNQARADMFEAQFAAIESADSSDDAKLIELSQTMGGMQIAAKTAANAVKAA
jgi:hypothetical protein